MYLAAVSSAYGRPKRRPSARRERDVPTSAERPDVDLVPFVATVRWQEYGIGLPQAERVVGPRPSNGARHEFCFRDRHRNTSFPGRDSRGEAHRAATPDRGDALAF